MKILRKLNSVGGVLILGLGLVIGCGGSGSSAASSSTGSGNPIIPAISVTPGDLYVVTANHQLSRLLQLGNVFQWDPNSVAAPTQIVQLDSSIVFAIGLVQLTSVVGNSSFIYSYSTQSGAPGSDRTVFGAAVNGNLNGTSLTQLSNVGSGITEITPTPSGFIALQGGSSPNLTIFNSAGSQVISVPVNGGYDYCAAQNKLVYVTRRTSDNYWLLNVATASQLGINNPTVLDALPPSDSITSVAISKDGSQIAFGDTEGTTGNLKYQSSSPGSQPSTVQSNPNVTYPNLAFSPTNTQLAYVITRAPGGVLPTTSVHVINPITGSGDVAISFFDNLPVMSMLWANSSGTSY